MWFRRLLFDLFGMYENEFQYWAIEEANKRMAAYAVIAESMRNAALQELNAYYARIAAMTAERRK